MNKPTDEELRTAAVRLYYDNGSVEVDPGATVSRARHGRPSGAYVQAWVWVADEDVSDEDRANANDTPCLECNKLGEHTPFCTGYEEK